MISNSGISNKLSQSKNISGLTCASSTNEFVDDLCLPKPPQFKPLKNPVESERSPMSYGGWNLSNKVLKNIDLKLPLPIN